jgi:hypothetical protein
MILEKLMLPTKSKPGRRRADRAGRALLWVPLALCGVVLAFLSSRRSFRRSRESRPASRPIRRISSNSRRLVLLRQAIIGNERAAIEEIFGPPPTVAGSSQAPTWYYPLDSAIGRVVVIEFDGPVARDAQFVDSPRTPRRS